MTDFATIDSANRFAVAAQGTKKLPPITYGLGPNQLNWLRANIVSFRHAEHQRALFAA
jgi:hypothetical protein